MDWRARRRVEVVDDSTVYEDVDTSRRYVIFAREPGAVWVRDVDTDEERTFLPSMVRMVLYEVTDDD